MQKKQYAAEYKAKIVLEILSEEMSISEIATREAIRRTQLQNWKKEFIENSARGSQNKIEKSSAQRVREAQEREELIKSRLNFWHTKQCCLGS